MRPITFGIRKRADGSTSPLYTCVTLLLLMKVTTDLLSSLGAFRLRVQLFLLYL